jgi:hypothetical protein
VFIIVKLLDITGVDCSDPSEDGKSGMSGMSGISVGSGGVLSIIFEVLGVSRGGVTRERAGSLMMIGGESAGNPSSGNHWVGVLRWSTVMELHVMVIAPSSPKQKERVPEVRVRGGACYSWENPWMTPRRSLCKCAINDLELMVSRGHIL